MKHVGAAIGSLIGGIFSVSTTYKPNTTRLNKIKNSTVTDNIMSYSSNVEKYFLVAMKEINERSKTK
jgi:hypothetical protein